MLEEEGLYDRCRIYATDLSESTFNVILCRNVLIYFAKPLQDRVHRLLYESLVT